MIEKINEDTGLIYVKEKSVANGHVKGHGYCTLGQAIDGKWYSINYYPKHPMNERGFNAEVRWEIQYPEYDLLFPFDIKE